MTDPDGERWHPRRPPRSTGPFSWLLPLALTALVIVLAWRLYTSSPAALRDAGAKPQPVAARGDLAADEKATVELFRGTSASVVHVTNLRSVRTIQRGRLNEMEIPQGTGTGFVWDAKGYVVTNFHVVQNGDVFKVTFSDHTEAQARVVGTDPYHDMAVLKIDAGGKQLPAIPIGSSRDLLVGQKVFAIGNPFGLDQTLTTGIISGLGREITSIANFPIQNAIQTDAAINPGNSGGPLLDSAGRVIGMNTAITSPSGASAGIGFAIPADRMNRIVPQLIRSGKYVRPGLGITVIGDRWANAAGVRGVIFDTVTPGGAAARAGLLASQLQTDGLRLFGKVGDVLVGVEGQRIETTQDLYRALDGHEVGQEVEVVYLRDGEEQRAKVKLVGLE